jgi:probable glucuronoxylan glucuronosyltransferase IRX7
VESVLGCIPVVIADNIRLPFPSIVQWQDISLQVAEKDIASLEMVLDHVVATNLTVIQKNLWDPVKRKALIFNRPMEVGDATWQVLRELDVLLDRSQRRTGGGEDQRGQLLEYTGRICCRLAILEP